MRSTQRDSLIRALRITIHSEEGKMKISKWAAWITLTAGMSLSAGGAMAQSGGNGNGGSGGGNAHGAATAGPTVGGDNTSAPNGSHKAPHFKHKRKAKPADTQ
jgi:hypothetical protein